jgi:hypothetical protein
MGLPLALTKSNIASVATRLWEGVQGLEVDPSRPEFPCH